MVDSWTLGLKTMSRLGLAIAGATVLLALGHVASAQAAPALTIASSASGGVTTSRTVSFSGTTDDSNVSDPIKLEIVGEHTGPITAETVPAGEGWAIESVVLPADDTYTAVVEQTNLLAETGVSQPLQFTVDTTKPDAGINTPAEGAHLNSSTVVFGGPAGHEFGDASTLTLLLFKGATASGTPEEISIERKGSSWSEPEGVHLPDGTYTAEVLQADAAGNVGSAQHTFTIETHTPKVTLASLPSFTSDSTPVVGGDVDRTKGVVESVTLRIYDGTAAAESAELAEEPITVTASGNTWSTTVPTPLQDGTYTAQAEQENLAGTPGFSAPTTFTVDTSAPQVTLSAPASSTGIETVSGTAGTARGDQTAVTVQVFSGPSSAGQSPIETVIVNATGASWSATLAGLGGGTYAVRAEQSDEAGNTGVSAESSFTVTSPGAPAASAPTASFTWIPATPVAGQAVSLVSNSAPGSSPIGAFAWDVAGNNSFAPGGSVMTTSFATAGSHVVHLRVTDGNGLSSVASRTIGVVAPSLTLLQPFPIVRIAGVETSSGVRVRLLTVQTPPSTKVVVTCKGPGCKTKSESRVAKASATSKNRTGAVTLAFQRFERPLHAGVILQIRVSKAGQIGKFTSFKIRRHKLPQRTDACLQPTSPAPIACPPS
jgi:hypothetical protein